MLTRDMIQGFIDGYITAGGDPTAKDDVVIQYLANHPVYKLEQKQIDQIASDLNSYRVSDQIVLAPNPDQVIQIK